jgi:hypothetical protein
MQRGPKNPDSLGSTINFKIIGLMVFFVIALHVYDMNAVDDPESFEFTDGLYTAGALACGICAVIVSSKYRGSEILGKTYFALGLGFLMLFVGDVVLNYFEIVLEIDPYPSLADVFYFAYLPLAIFHLVVNIRYFKKKIDSLTILGLSVLSISIILLYSAMSFEELDDLSFDFYFGLLYIVPSSVMLSLAILGAMVFRSSILGIPWLLLATGITIFTIADVWYYYLELFELYDGTHPVNSLWVFSFMIIVYALYKHKKIL